MRIEFTKLTRVFVALVLAAVVCSCASDSADFEVDNAVDPNEIIDPNSVGYISLSSVALAVSEDEETHNDNDGNALSQVVRSTRADESSSVDTDSYLVVVTDSDGEVKYSKSYADVKSENTPLQLPAGYYTIQAKSHAEIPASGSYPCYTSAGGDDDTYAVGDDKTVETTQITCRLSNIKVSVDISADLLSQFKPNDEIDTEGGETALTATLTYGSEQITFVGDEIGSKIYYYAYNSSTSQISIKLVGLYNTAPAGSVPEYSEVSWSQSVSAVASGQTRKISINIDNYNDGKLLCNVEVESWIVSDTTLSVDVQNKSLSLYQIAESEIFDPDTEKTDEFSPTTIINMGSDVFDTSEIFTFGVSLFNEDFQTYNNLIAAYVTPFDGTTVKSVSLIISSENEELTQALKDAQFDNGVVPLWSSDSETSVADMSQYLTITNNSGVVKIAVLYQAMVMLERYKGDHTIKILAVGSNNRKSYTTFNVEVISEAGPEIEWLMGSDGTIYDFETRYKVYTEADVRKGAVNPEIKINITTGTGITDLRVVLSGDVLVESALEELGLKPSMNLVNPESESVSDGLIGLGFPVGEDLVGLRELTIDISGFMPMLAILPATGVDEGDAVNTEFTIYVTDINGEISRQIMVYHAQP